MSCEANVVKELFLPELRLIQQVANTSNVHRTYFLIKESEYEVCPKCATIAKTIYDHVVVTVRDVPLRAKNVILKIKKRRFLCKHCKSVFREPVQGIYKGFRTTHRYRKYLMWCCSQFTNLKRVAHVGKCSEWLVYTCHYEQLRVETNKYQTPWPKTVGIDEHTFVRNKYGRKDFATVFVDYNHGKVREVIHGRTPGELLSSENLLRIPGRENVKNVVIDLSSGFKSTASSLFPNAIITADKFHVIKLLFPALMKYKKEVIGNARNNPLKKAST